MVLIKVIHFFCFRKRRSSIDKTDEEKSPQKSGSRDYKIPKKRNSGPEINPDPTTGSNPLASPKTEMKFELVEDALEAMFAGVSGKKNNASSPSKRLANVNSLSFHLCLFSTVNLF